MVSGQEANTHTPEGKASDAEPLASARSVYAGKVYPNLQISTFRNIDRLFPSRRVPCGCHVQILEHSDVSLADVHLRSDGENYDLFDYLSRNRVAGLLILKDGRIVLEKYEFDNTEHSRWMSMSLAKSVSSTLVGMAIRDGTISSVDDQLVNYLPELKGTGYDGVTVRNLLQMTSGVRWDETPTDPGSDRGRMLELQIAQEPGAIMRYMAALPRVAEAGTLWNYSTGETHVVGALLRAATGLPLADYLSRKIWAKVGMEADASWWLESPDGLEVAGSGISATLRDYGRFGLLMMTDGVIAGERCLPEGWVKEAGAPRMIRGQRVDYGYMWWPVPDTKGSFDRGAFTAAGLFGQYIYVSPRDRIVIVVWSARSKPLGAEVIDDYVFFNAVVEALSKR